MTDEETRAAAARARAFFEGLAPADLDRLGDAYAPDAYFRDPFNEVRGVEPIRHIYSKMYETLDDARFEIQDCIADAGGAMLTWDMVFRVRRWHPERVQRIHGATHLRFDDLGRIVYHRDYWDVAHELYEKLPVVGALMRMLRRRLG
jgi:steroid Delta-isomerase